MDNSRLDVVIPALRALLLADATLVNAQHLNGPHVYLRMSSELVQQIPSVQYYLLDTGTDETFETATIRWEVWATTFSKALALEKRLRFLLHREGQVTLAAGVTVVLTFDASYDVPAEQLGVMRRIVETRIDIVRQRAA